MTFLAPTTLSLALAASVPVLVVLYMLKLRRRPERIPSTLLWRKSVEDLVANSPFQRLRWSTLLLLQLLVAAALAAALGRPASRDADAVRGRVIVLIDRSASMNARVDDDRPGGPPRTRLDVAKERVERLVDRLGADDAGSQMMLVAFAREPVLLSAFERSRGRLRDALAALSPTDEEADLAAALRLAEGFARQGGGDDARDATDEPLPSIVVVTDGGVAAPRDGRSFAVPASSVHVELVESAEPVVAPSDRRRADEANGGSTARPTSTTTPVDNVGITALAAERGYDDPAVVSLFARLSNAGPSPIETVATVRQDGRVALRRTITIPPATDDGLGEATLLERLEAPDQAVVIVSHAHADALPDDDVAAAVLPAPRTLQVALVTDGRPFDPFLRRLLKEAIESPTGDAAAGGAASIREYEIGNFLAAPPPADLVIFDRVAPPTLPASPSWTIGAAPPGTALEPDLHGARRVLGWDRQHALTRHVDLDDLVYNAAALRLSDDWTALAQGRDGPLIAVTTQRGVRHAALAFPLAQSNLPILPTFPILVQNVLDHLAAAGAGQVARVVRPGDPVTVAPLPGATSIVVEALQSGERDAGARDAGGRRSNAMKRSIDVDASDGTGSRIALPAIERVGLSLVTGAAPPDDVIAVNMLSDLETDIRPREAPLIVTSSSVESRQAASSAAERWPWAVLAALAVLIVEWIAYLLRAGR